MRPSRNAAVGKKEVSAVNLGSILFSFLHLYGSVFNYEDVGLSVIDRGSYFLKVAHLCCLYAVSVVLGEALLTLSVVTAGPRMV